MARKRRPAISLIILFVILLLLFFFAGAIVELVSEWSGQGSFTYSYLGGNEAIVSIRYSLPQDLADSMVLKQPTGWTVNLDGNILSLTGGTLSPGETVTVDYRLKEYIAGGLKTITTTSTTVSGVENIHQTNLQVPDVFLLALANILYQNNIWLLILAIIVLIAIIALFVVGKKDKEKETQQAQALKQEPQNPAA